MVDSGHSSIRAEFVPLCDAIREFGKTEGELIRAGIEGRIRVYFWLNEVRLAQLVKHDKESNIITTIDEPKRARFYYIPVFRPQLAEIASGRDMEASALTRADDEGADGKYWTFMWDRDESGAVIPMPRITRDGLFVRRSDFQQRSESTEKERVEPPRADDRQTPDDAHEEEAGAGYEATLAGLFDPVRKEQLETMFPDGGKWHKYLDKASINGLREAAKAGRGQFNPFFAAKWWIGTKGPVGWTWERCLRKLANNLPPRSRDFKNLLVSDLD